MKDKAVVFDLFGTLVDMLLLPEYESTLLAMAGVLGASPKDFARLWFETANERQTGVFPNVRTNVEHICRALGVPPADDRTSEAVKVRWRYTRRSLTPRPDAVETLTQLKQRGYSVGLISDCSPEVPLLWQETPFVPLIDAAIFSCVVGLKKPDSRIYRLACQKLEVIPENCLYVGDGASRELTGASQVGMRPVLIRVPCEDSHDPFRPDAEEWQGTTISSLKEVMTFLEWV